MEKKIKKIQNVENGITLIALIVTIIVLIILAGISIAALNGEDGLITQSRSAKENAESSEEREIIEISAVQAVEKNKYGNVTEDELQNRLNKNIGEKEYKLEKIDEELFKVTIEKSQREYFINKDGEVFTEDNTGPTVNILVKKITSSSITVEAIAVDKLSGLKKENTYKYYIKKSSEADSSYEEKEISSNKIYTFNGLDTDTSYDIKIITEDNVGNTGEGTKTEQKTGTIPILAEGVNITFTANPIGWTNGNVTVRANTTLTEYILQTSKDAINWETTNPQEYTSNGTMYARLWDGTNASNYASCSITNIDTIVPNITSVTPLETSVSIVATDSDSKINGYTVTQSTTIPTSWTSFDATDSLNITISNLSTATTYYGWVRDMAGNTSYKQFKTKNPIEIAYHVTTSTTYTEKKEPGEDALSYSTFTPSLSGYTFVGWREDNTASGTVLSSKTVEITAINLYAVFKKTITITYYNNTTTSATSTGTQYYNNGNIVNPKFTINQASRSGFTARGWSTGTEANASVTYSSISNREFSANATLYGLYQATVTVSYNGNGSTGGSTANQTGTRYYNSSGKESNPSFKLSNIGFTKKYNYSNNKWAKGSTSGTQYAPGTTLTLSSNTTFYALWTTYSAVTLYDSGTKNYNTITGMQSECVTGKINFSSSYIYMNAEGNKTVIFNNTFNNNYRYLKVIAKATRNTTYGNYNVARFFVTKTTTMNDGMPTGVLANYYITDESRANSVTSFTTFTLDLNSVTNSTYYVGLHDCDSDYYIQKVWLTN